MNKDSIHKLYEELDLNKDGKVSMDEFISKILDVTSEKDKTSFQQFFEKLEDFMTNKANIIIKKLKKLREFFENDENKKNEFDWYNLLI